jgi:hypothetical protein
MEQLDKELSAAFGQEVEDLSRLIATYMDSQIVERAPDSIEPTNWGLSILIDTMVGMALRAVMASQFCSLDEARGTLMPYIEKVMETAEQDRQLKAMDMAGKMMDMAQAEKEGRQ